jgi:hypothetical protein
VDRSGHVVGIGLAAFALAFGLSRIPHHARPAAPASIASAADEALEVPRRIRAILAGGGPSPDLDQVSLEEDLALAGRVLGTDDAVVLFAGGPGTRAVQERDPDPAGDPVVFALGNLFYPRGGRDAHYRRTRLALHGGATLDEIFAAFEVALSESSAPLLFYFTGHGNGGERPEDSIAETWGGAAFDARALAEELEDTGTSRRVRMVITSCYSGGFAELAFRNADVTLGPTDQDRCGFFSTAWDRESGGCDSDPDRGVHEGFGVYFLSALAGQDREGRDARGRIDLDGDGAITLSEAMTYVRIASRAIDVPITTSERLLGAIAPREGASVAVSLPEEQAVIDALLGSLGLASVEQVRTSLSALEARATENEDALAEAYAEARDRAADVAGVVLSRWPVLDDPYHPDYPAMLAESHDALTAYLEGDEVIAWTDAEDDASALQITQDGLEVQIAVHLRILQAAETMELAGRLRARDGEGWAAFERMRACERSVP